MSPCVDSAWALSAPLVLTAVVGIGVTLLAQWVRRQRHFAGRESFIALHAASVWWMVAASVEMAAQGAPCKVFWASMAWPGILMTPTFWAIFLWQYVSGIRQPLARRHVLGVLVVPALIWMMALSNPWHGWFYTAGTGPLNTLPGAPIRYQHGPLFYAAALYVYLLMLFCLGVLLRAAILSHGLHRRHYLAFMGITAVPWVGNIGYVVSGWTLFGFDPTPFSFAFTLSVFAWLIIKARLFDLRPIARDLLRDTRYDPVLVVDAHWRVIEASEPALQLLGLRSGWQGRPLSQWPIMGAVCPQLLKAVARSGHQPPLIVTGTARSYEVHVQAINRITRPGNEVLGRMIYLREVTPA